jgi:hypothetical protein
MCVEQNVRDKRTNHVFSNNSSVKKIPNSLPLQSYLLKRRATQLKHETTFPPVKMHLSMCWCSKCWILDFDVLSDTPRTSQSWFSWCAKCVLFCIWKTFDLRRNLPIYYPMLFPYSHYGIYIMENYIIYPMLFLYFIPMFFTYIFSQYYHWYAQFFEFGRDRVVTFEA